MFELSTSFSPCGDQPQAIEKLTQEALDGKKAQVLLGITGSGKTFTMANVIARLQRPALIIAHNKTLAAQLYQEFQSFFPTNAVEYFVSYYDYYQPEAYLPRSDTYIEKDFAINDKIDKMRLSATRSLLERRDVIIVASVSCIYGLGTPEYYKDMVLKLATGHKVRRDEALLHLVNMQYTRNDIDFMRGTFRVRGDVLDILPAYEEDIAYRIEFFGDDVERVSEFDPLTGKTRRVLQEVCIYPGSHYVTPEEVRLTAIDTIKRELAEQIAFFTNENKLIEAQRIQQRTTYDLEMLREMGFCNGIENYSRHFSQRVAGEPPPCLIDYFPKDFLLFIDESHQTIPQIRAMYNGDRARKTSLVDFGFRLPSAYDNRPLQFEEFSKHINQVIYVSATPSEYEVMESAGVIVEQVIRPTGLLDPLIEVRPAATQVDDCLAEIHAETLKKGRVLVTTLTKRLAEELTSYLVDLGIKAEYLHSEVDTLDRMKIIHDLRRGRYDVLVGINLLREGLDLPEVTLVAILDADKEGFLRSRTSLIQTCGRAARNEKGRVIMYADKMTDSMQHTIRVTEERRRRQEEYNKEHGIVPKTVQREITLLSMAEEAITDTDEPQAKKKKEQALPQEITIEGIRKKIADWDKAMRKAAKDLRFEDAAHARDMMHKYQEMELTFG
ncbi:MAG: excinuclease ABC subunit UvrB [Verrucomicrobia bacterium]|nr:excinuclease ABC subunit UvrB [Verrucomicrobiota bacterium]